MERRKKYSVRFVVIAFLVVFILVFLIVKAVNCITAETGTVTSEQAVEFLEELGWKTGSVSQDEITIPAEFSDVFEYYNTIQKNQGYDLSKYRCDTVTLYTVEILNFKDSDGNILDGIKAHVLTYGGKVIGGDLCNTALDGFMTGLDGESA